MSMKNKGFTLVEMLVTILLVSIGLIGVLAFFNTSLGSQFDAKNELIAAGLAQEGTELVRNIKDFNQLNSGSPLNLKWYSNLWSANTGGASLCHEVDYNSLSGSNRNCYNDVAHQYQYLCFDDNSRYSQCSNGSSGQTIFTRTITITISGDLDKGGSLTITSSVNWNNRQTKAVDILYGNNY